MLRNAMLDCIDGVADAGARRSGFIAAGSRRSNWVLCAPCWAQIWGARGPLALSGPN